MSAQGVSMVSDSGSGYFVRGAAYGEAAWQMPVGQCVVSTASETDLDFLDRDTPLDAGPALELRGPKGARTLKKQEGVYTADLGTQMDLPAGTPPIPGFSNELFLEPGDYTVTGPGGPDVGPFTAKLKLGTRLDWTNRARFTRISRSENQQVEWSGGTPGDLVMIVGAASQGKSVASFVCTERVERGAFTVPASVLSRLPASNRASMMLHSAPAASPTFTAPGLDWGWIAGYAGVMQTVTLQ
jgi:hypothetical protein